MNTVDSDKLLMIHNPDTGLYCRIYPMGGKWHCNPCTSPSKDIKVDVLAPQMSGKFMRTTFDTEEEAKNEGHLYISSMNYYR